MYALYVFLEAIKSPNDVCLICMPYMYALYVPHMYALYVFLEAIKSPNDVWLLFVLKSVSLPCMPYADALYVRLICVP